MSLLSDGEIEEIQNMEFSQNDWLWFYTRAIESAILARLKSQAPFGHYENGRWSLNTDGGPTVWRKRKEYTGAIYTHPIPADDVVRDAARYRWLREQGYGGYAICKWDGGSGDYFRCIAPKELIDEAIDKAMGEPK